MIALAVMHTTDINVVMVFGIEEKNIKFVKMQRAFKIPHALAAVHSALGNGQT